MDRLTEKVLGEWKDLELKTTGCGVVTGVSGGADSMCLLYVLQALKVILNLTIYVVHINHGIRGESADLDQLLVEEHCRALHITCFLFKENIPEMAKKAHCSEEEMGRMIRYQRMEQVRQETKSDYIAVAHHLDDLSETVLMNIFRGSGLTGLRGIPQKRDRIIRPLLHIRRSDIEYYMQQRNLSFRVDETNLQTEYTRNKVRLKVIPYIESEINSAASEHIAELANMAGDVNAYIEKEARACMQTIVSKQKEGYRIDVKAFDQIDVVLQREILRIICAELKGHLLNLSFTHIETLRRFLGGMSGKKIELPGMLRAKKEFDRVYIYEEKLAKEVSFLSESILTDNLPFLWKAKDLSIEIIFARISRDKNLQIPKNIYTKWLDYDKIKNGLVLRYRQSGDYMILKDGRKKLLRRLMMDDKVPQSMRAQMLLLADGDHIIWIPQMGRISEYYKITDETSHILTVELKENKNEREG